MCTVVWGQKFSYSVYNEKNGVKQPYVYGITQSDNGYLCFVTSEGAFRFDGKTLVRIDTKNRIKEPFYKSILVTKDKNIFLGSNSGGFYQFQEDKLVFKRKTDKNTTPVNAILELDKSIYACYQNGEILSLDPVSKKISRFTLPKDHVYSQFAVYNNNIIATFEAGFHVVEIKKNKLNIVKTLKVNDDAIESIHATKTELYIGTAASGVYTYREAEGLKKMNLGSEFDQAGIKSICKDKMSSLWISIFGKGVFEIKRNTETGKYYKRTQLTTSRGLPSEFISKIFIDDESNLWFGSYGEGLLKLNSNFLIEYDLSSLNLGVLVNTISGKDELLCGMEKGIAVLDPINDTMYPWKYNAQLPVDQILSIQYDKNAGITFIGSKNSGLFSLKDGEKTIKKIFLSDDNLSKTIRHLTVAEDQLFISTLNGLYEYSIKTGKITVYSAADGLPHNSINSTYLLSDGKLLIATVSSGIFYLENNKIQEMKTESSYGMLDVFSFLEDRRGGIWMGTNGQGLLHLVKGKITQIGTQKGLYSNFVYQLSLDKKNTIWCGHFGGLSRVNMNEKVVQRYGDDHNLATDFIMNSVNVDANNNLWFGTNKGLLEFSLFHDKYNLKQLKPMYVSAYSSSELLTYSETLLLPFSERNIRIHFKAISLSNPDEVYYQYRLLGSQNEDWSKVQQTNSAAYPYLWEGSYSFEVRVRIGKGEWSAPENIVNVIVEKPIWKQWWYMMLMLICGAGLIVFLVNYRTLKLRRQKDELEVKLAVRTKEIEQQKNQIKIQYQETQDSINYGVRIQRSLLPEASRLAAIIPESFVFLQPKDKVSGDFYYFERFNDKLIITVADATGHGVPGAFISLIGFVTIKELINRREFEAPDQILANLDRELNHTLHQFNAPGEGKDGMDMAICEIDLISLKIKMASALRPIWIFRSGEFEKIRSSKSTIGGGMNGTNAPLKEFDLEERQLQKGDTIYMFSDGYVDQFGSELNKKLMSKRFLNLLTENNHRPMAEQGKIVANFLNDWKGDFDQTDDILVIGLRL